MKYLVSYFHPAGQGRAVLTTDRELDTEEHIVEVEEMLAKKNGFTTVGITNFILLKD
jgi:hypothetical protein